MNKKMLDFLNDYTKLFEELADREKLKLDALTSGDLSGVEQCVTITQATSKRLQNIESKRLELFKSEGLEGKSFKDLIDMADDKEQFSNLFTRLENAITEVKFLNKKSCKIANDGLRSMGIKPGDYYNDGAGAIFDVGKPSSGGSTHIQTKV